MAEEYYEFSEDEIRMDDKELMEFFNKYDFLDLFVMSKIFENVDYVDFDVTNEQEKLNTVFKTKQDEFVDKCFRKGFNSVGIQDKIKNYSIDQLFRKNNLLNEKELKFLYMMVEYASSFIELIQNYPENNFNEEDYYTLMELDFLQNTLHREIYKRINKEKQMAK